MRNSKTVIAIVLTGQIVCGIGMAFAIYDKSKRLSQPAPTPSPEVEYDRVIAECDNAIHIVTEDKQECQERLYEVSDRLNKCDDLLRRVFGIPPKSK